MTLICLIMLIISGGSTFIAPVRKAVLAQAVIELLRPVESGGYCATSVLMNSFRLSPGALANTPLLVMFFKRKG